ncbi:MAG: flagellar motor switch protein FliM, partial [candidate division NC10 bacterium]
MPDILSQDEIDALLSATGSTEVAQGVREVKPAATSIKPVVTYDFKHPNRVSKDQVRTLENLHGGLARLLAASFSTLQRAVVDTDIAFVDQTTYAEFIMSLSNPSCSYVFTIEPLGGPAIIDFSLPVAYSFIDRQFGGRGTTPMGEARALTSIERGVMSKVVQRTMEDLETTWEPLLKIQVSDAELETNPEFMQVASPSDTVILIAFEVNSQHASGLVNLCYPFFTLEPVMNVLNVRTWANREKGRRDSEKKYRVEQLGHVMASVRAVLGHVELPFGEVLNLRVGAVVKLAPASRVP